VKAEVVIDTRTRTTIRTVLCGSVLAFAALVACGGSTDPSTGAPSSEPTTAPASTDAGDETPSASSDVQSQPTPTTTAAGSADFEATYSGVRVGNDPPVPEGMTQTATLACLAGECQLTQEGGSGIVVVRDGLTFTGTAAARNWACGEFVIPGSAERTYLAVVVADTLTYTVTGDISTAPAECGADTVAVDPNAYFEGTLVSGTPPTG